MTVTDSISPILPAGSLLRLKTLEDRIAYRYSQDRIDQGLDEDGNDIEQECHPAGDNVDDHHQDMQWLLKLLVKLEELAPPDEAEENEAVQDNDGETALEQDYRLQHEQLTERVSSCLAHFCGRAASGAMTRTWTFKTTPPQSLQIHDPSFTGGDVGFKTFGSAYLLSKHIAQGDLPQLEPWTSLSSSRSLSTASLPLPKILELGSGTGLVGFTAALFSNPQGPKVILSDYHPNVISTLHHNSALNHLETKCDIQLLDWRDILRTRKLRWNAWQQQEPLDSADGLLRLKSTEYDNVAEPRPTPSSIVSGSASGREERGEEARMDLIVGAEVVYDHGHAELVAHVVDEYLKRELISEDRRVALARRRPAFHIMFPMRKTHADVIADFDFWMDRMGLVDCRAAQEWGREDGETKFLYHWREYVRKEHLEEK
ncbi:hypothetical protein BGZ70_008848 [Mortierella alpina]|uniref:Uncharacterized protein n=1 Tax=Mortierella alpina TaxID=64518 RepID=A0A9P6J2M1_MORAP|nr:hypothetical protein BGZ70_008848 [Mortierella alpina]